MSRVRRKCHKSKLFSRQWKQVSLHDFLCDLLLKNLRMPLWHNCIKIYATTLNIDCVRLLENYKNKFKMDGQKAVSWFTYSWCCCVFRQRRHQSSYRHDWYFDFGGRPSHTLHILLQKEKMVSSIIIMQNITISLTDVRRTFIHLLRK